MTRILLATLLLVAGCYETSRNDLGSGSPGIPGSDSFQDDDPPIGCQTGPEDCAPSAPGAADEGGASEPAGAPVGGPCDNSNQCVDGAACGATFEDGEAGPLLCRAECIELDDASAWCSDDSACCSGVCGPRGLCLEAEGSGGTDSTSGGTG